MDVRDELLQRNDVSAEDIEDIIRLAGSLRDESGAGDEVPSLADASAKRFVESAIEQIRAEKLKQIIDGQLQKERRNERIASALLVVLMAGAVMTGIGFVGSQGIVDAAKAVKEAEVALDQVYEREFELVPVVLALSGSNGQQVPLLPDVDWSQATPQEKGQACSTFIRTMAEVLNGVQVVAGSDEATMLQSLRGEIDQLEQRTIQESENLAEAGEQWGMAAATLQGRLAIWLELAPDYGDETYFSANGTGTGADS